MKNVAKCLVVMLLLSSCVSKKDIFYLQDANENAVGKVNYQNPTIQPNDILKITVESVVPEAAIPYNKVSTQRIQTQNIELLQLEGYLVSLENTINFPVLGEISTKGFSTQALGNELKKLLEEGGHLVDANVEVRLINAKVTILGEVNKPGTYNFTEQNITIFQALGYANDLTIRGKREDILITREVDGVRKVSHIDLTKSDFMSSEYYFVKPNDVIIVNQNSPRVTNAGYIDNIGTVLTIASLVLSSIVLLSR